MEFTFCNEISKSRIQMCASALDKEYADKQRLCFILTDYCHCHIIVSIDLSSQLKTAQLLLISPSAVWGQEFIQLDYSVIQIHTSSLLGSTQKQKDKWFGIVGIPPTWELFIAVNINLPWLPNTPFSMICQNSELYVFDYISVYKFAVDTRLT